MQEQAAVFAARVQDALDTAFGEGTATVSPAEGEALAFDVALSVQFGLTFGLDEARFADPEPVQAAGAVMTAMSVGREIAEPLRELATNLAQATPEMFTSEAADTLISTLVDAGLVQEVSEDAEEVPEEAGDD